MPLGFLGNVFGSAITAAANTRQTRETNEMNYKIAQETNAANREMVEMQNKAAKQEAELAYKRSSAPNQVGLMTAAGMSRAGAINALNGGGSYTPAPVNTSQDQAPQMQIADLSALANIGQGLEAMAQRKHDAKMQDKQIQAQKDMQKEQLDFEKQKWQDEQAIRDATLTSLQFQNKINEALANYKDENGNKTNLLVEGQAAERIANIADARLNTLYRDALNELVELPANALSSLLKKLKSYLQDNQQFIADVRAGKKTAEEVRDYSKYDNLPNYVESDGKKFKRYKLSDGVYEWREIR